MVIRRIREHVATQNWFAVGIDFLIVVAGIVIGTKVNNWNQTRIEREQGKEYRERLIADLRANETDFVDRKAYYGTVRKHANSALAALDRPVGENGAAFLVDAYIASHILVRHPKRFTYDELISTGRFGEIGDAGLREHVAEYYVRLAANQAVFSVLPPYRDYIRERMPNVAQQAIRSQCGVVLADLPRNCVIRLEPAVVSRSVEAIRSSPAMITGLTRVIADLDVKLWLLDSLIERERKMRSMIEKA